MIFCEKCFTDLELSAMIRPGSKKGKNDYKKGECPICQSKNVYLYDTKQNNILKDIFDDLLALYVTEDKLPAEFSVNEKKYLCDDLLQNWDIFNQKLSSADIESIIKNTCGEYCENNQDIFSKKVSIPEKTDMSILSTNGLVKTKNWNDFVNELKTKNRFHTNLINENVLKKYCSFLEKRYKRGQKFYRGRISKDRSGFIMSNMGAPPFELAKPGRANAEGIRHLYLASDEKTTIHEVRAGAYDIITVGAFELQRDIVIVDFQQLTRISPFVDEINLLEYALNVEHLRKMNQEMSRTLRRDDSPLDYIPTQFIADYIKSFLDGHSNPLYRGIEYRSTMNKKGYNLVAFYPEDFTCISVKTVSVANMRYKYEIFKNPNEGADKAIDTCLVNIDLEAGKSI